MEMRDKHGVLEEILNGLLKEHEDRIVLKGAFSTIENLKRVNPEVNFRLTTDIDLYMDPKNKRLERLKEILTQVLPSGMRFEVDRHPKRKSQGKIILFWKEEPFAQIDISVGEVQGVIEIKRGDSPVYISGVEDILADKIDAISREKVLRRVKDLYDVFLFATNLKISYEKIKEKSALLPKNKTDLEREGLGKRFHELLTNKEELKQQYEKLDSMRFPSKPDFQEVYSLVTSFLKPFLDGEEVHRYKRIWNPITFEWESKDPFGLDDLEDSFQ